jgi:integrase
MTETNGRLGRPFGSVRLLPSGRYQARYTGPDGRSYTARTSGNMPLTFSTERRARDELARIMVDTEKKVWMAPGSSVPQQKPLTFGEYSAAWLRVREPLSPSTRNLYAQLLRDWLLPTFENVPVKDITTPQVTEWYAYLAVGPTARSHAYSLLRTILNTAVEEKVIIENPCRVKGGGQVKRAKTINPATVAELEVIVEHMPEKWRALVLLAAWCGLRWGEACELRGKDLDLVREIVHVRRSVVRTGKGKVVKTPKSADGTRDWPIPPHVMPVVREHLARHAQVGAEGLLFPAADGGHLAAVTFGRAFYPAREAAGRPDLHFHDLRHTGLTNAAIVGATTAELMAMAGHSTPAMAMRYQHVVSNRPQAIARMLSELANGTVTEIDSKRA